MCEGSKGRERYMEFRKIQKDWHVAEALLETREGNKLALQAIMRSGFYSKCNGQPLNSFNQGHELIGSEF